MRIPIAVVATPALYCQTDQITVQLIPLSAQRFLARIERSRHAYESDLITIVESPQETHRRAKGESRCRVS